ncbi:MAG: hypothetical protein KF832_27040 [Caldilineaceae bacterium]|nr:hypothetical protein [Caldilineaceae bacterium]
MSRHAIRLWLLGLGLVVVGCLAVWQLSATHAQGGSCTTGLYLAESLPTGAGWDLCWATRDQEGVVLTDIYYTTPAGLRRKVLQEASLAQIEVQYDDGRAAFYYASTPGLGGASLLSLTAADCPNGVLLSQNDQAALCKQTAARGYLYKYYTQQRQGTAMTLFSAAAIGQQLYIVQWRFLDDGTIEPTVGEGGRLWRQSQDPQSGWPMGAEKPVGIGYITNYWWRLDFDLGGNGANDQVEEFAVNPANANTQRITTVTALTTETARSTDPDVKRSWRVRDGSLTNSDGHAISYHLDPKEAGYRYVGPTSAPWSQQDFYVTVDRVCERLAIQNPTTNGCADNVAGFVNGESLAGADVVIWYRVTTHRLPRAEDRPVRTVQWQGFQLLARDWTAQNPF